jgi:hypothetical protein
MCALVRFKQKLAWWFSLIIVKVIHRFLKMKKLALKYLCNFSIVM